MTDLVVPKFNNNDESYILVEWLFDDGEQVGSGDAVAVIETSKATQDLIVEGEGVLHRLKPEKAECGPGDVIGRLFASEPDRQSYLAGEEQAGKQEAASNTAAEPTMTESARAFAAEHGISADRLRALGKSLIRRSDVERLIEGELPANKSRLLPISRRQQAIGAVVSESHRTIPAAFTLMRVDVGRALSTAATLAERVGAPVGLPELLIKAVAGLHEEFPLFFARAVDQAHVEPAAAAHVGVTVDVGTGLFIPVVRDAGQRSIPEIVDILMDFRIKGLRNTLTEQDFADAVIVVSLNNDDAVVFARPIVFPGHTCMVSLGGVLTEPTLDGAGNLVARQVVHMGLAYDHRIVNGRDAVTFLQRLRARLEAPEHLERGDAG
ncbi:2-oxo acid dehydrogenase subunit E2 [Couchioplanes caeruleus]|uniref:Dihydrolipoamide acetyltransferase component of pyruvate dehydrogenase complex n=1 Tax=Couchioplanes caeruleus TaxID=56438 RepID=A0A3N1GMC2_9ACTN|nr:2-oxo acid dehydrogenase subunit E2 [Couchioplanes caeruleus]ROP31266.1 2-oxoglutarate dehydrogenase E2 component (dihydrolipoamide succinyltransferase) [Couchioplanes caeruleus]